MRSFESWRSDADRRGVPQATFSGSAATVALANGSTVFVAHPNQLIDEHDFARDALVTRMPSVEGTTELAPIAQHLLKEIAHELDVHGWVTTLAEQNVVSAADRRYD